MGIVADKNLNPQGHVWFGFCSVQRRSGAAALLAGSPVPTGDLQVLCSMTYSSWSTQGDLHPFQSLASLVIILVMEVGSDRQRERQRQRVGRT